MYKSVPSVSPASNFNTSVSSTLPPVVHLGASTPEPMSIILNDCPSVPFAKVVSAALASKIGSVFAVAVAPIVNVGEAAPDAVVNVIEPVD